MSRIYMLTILVLLIGVGYGIHFYYQSPLRIGMKDVSEKSIKVEVEKYLQKEE